MSLPERDERVVEVEGEADSNFARTSAFDKTCWTFFAPANCKARVGHLIA